MCLGNTKPPTGSSWITWSRSHRTEHWCDLKLLGSWKMHTKYEQRDSTSYRSKSYRQYVLTTYRQMRKKTKQTKNTMPRAGPPRVTGSRSQELMSMIHGTCIANRNFYHVLIKGMFQVNWQTKIQTDLKQCTIKHLISEI